MYKALKIELKLTVAQKIKVCQTIGTERFIYNEYIKYNKERNIELRLVDTFYPSSKTCSCCGSVKKDLKLNDRIYKCCNCGLEMDRDYNASINLEKAKVYKIIA